MARRSANNSGAFTEFMVNFLYGCRKVDGEAGCRKCYLLRYWHWYASKMNAVGATNPFQGKYILFDERERLRELDKVPHGSFVFVNGLSDTFAEFVTDEQRDRWHSLLEARPWYQFMVCTKRTGLMWLYYSKHKVPSNVWVGTSISRKKDMFRLDLLRKIDGKRWVSFEPLIEDIGEASLQGLSFVCLGGETEPGREYKEFDPAWGDSMLANCRRDGVAFWYDGGNGLNDGRDGAPSPDHVPNSGRLPQERPPFVGCECIGCKLENNGA